MNPTEKELNKRELAENYYQLKNSYKELYRIRVPTELIIRLGNIEETLSNLLNIISFKLSIGIKKEDKGLSKKTRQEILNRDNYTCQNCGITAEGFQDIKLHIDHIIPKSKKGTDDKNNLRVLCSSCNLLKKNYIFNELKKNGIEKENKKNGIEKEGENDN